jgi:hypothetical protein
MKNTILVVIPMCANDAILAEHLCDFIYLVNRREKEGHCLLAVAGDVHEELSSKVRLAATVAFESVEIVNGPKIVDPNKNIHINRLVGVAAAHIAKSHRVPWLLLEPDAVPLKYGWLDDIAEAHYAQPKRYSGNWKKIVTPEQYFLNRIAVYPHDSAKDLELALAGPRPFNMAAGEIIVPKSTMSRYVDEAAAVDENYTPRAGAVLLHSDKNAVFKNKLRPKFEDAAKKKK